MFQQKFRSHLHLPLLSATGFLLAIGILNLHSATLDVTTGGVSSLVWSQIVSMVVAGGLGLLVLMIDYRFFSHMVLPFYFLSLILLLLVALFGKEVAGNQNWLVLGPLTFQPSELAKLALVLILARYFSDNPAYGRRYSLVELIRPSLLILLPLGLILSGKDIGSAFLLLVLSASFLFFAGVEKRVWILFLVALIVGGTLAYRFALSPHQKSRISAFLTPKEDPKGTGYHLMQSKITVGSGKLIGRGYLRGLHSKLLYLPEKHTDFIFPVLAEEWGFVGSTVVLALYALLLTFGFSIASKARERFGLFLGVGLTLLIFWQVAINLGGVLGIIPLTGVTLPLLSYGGSSMVSILVAIALLLNISMRRFIF